MKISLIISTYNAPDFLKLVLRSIAEQIIPSNCNLEVLIADDGSGFETESLIAKYQENFRFKLLHIWHADAGHGADRLGRECLRPGRQGGAGQTGSGQG